MDGSTGAMKNANASFGHWLKQRRKALDLTQGELANRLGCSIITIQKIEADERRPSKRITQRLADALAISLDERTPFVAFARRSAFNALAVPTGRYSTQVAHRLPHQSTPFVGRRDELAEITRLLADPSCRLLTVVGPGGIGKTRLALQAASQKLADYSDGVYFVALAPVSASDSLVSPIAHALDLQFYAGNDPKQQLLQYLAEKQSLLVLDNFEHLLDSGTELVLEILRVASHVQILTTSRERLNLVEEWVFELGGLDIPVTDTETDIENYSAVSLFVQCAERVQVGFRLDELQGPAVIRTCRLVGGIPLGIELAAAWVPTLSCDAIAEEIGHSLDILETSMRNIPPRHRSMRAAFEPTWQRLSNAERAVFKKLSVFRRGFTREAARVVAGATLRNLSALVAKSLLQSDEQGRYAIHELLRQYAEEQLTASPQERDMVRGLHCAFYAGLIGQLVGDWTKAPRRQIIDSIEHEIENVYVAFNVALDHRKFTDIRRFLEAMEVFYARGRFFEGADILARAVQHLREYSNQADEEEQLVLALCLCGQAQCLSSLSRGPEAQERLYEGLAILRSFAPRRETALILSWLGIVAIDYAERTRWLLEALPMTRTLGDKQIESRVVGTLSELALRRGEPEEARQHAQEALRLSREAKDPQLEARSLLRIGESALIQGAYAEARQHVQSALVLSQAIEMWFFAQWAYDCLGQLAFLEGDYAEAQAYFQKSQTTAPGAPVLIERLLKARVGLGRVACALGAYEEARRHLLEALTIGKELHYDPPVLYALEGAAELLIHLNQHDQATELSVLVLNHANGHWLTRYYASRRLARLESKLPPRVYSAAQERGRKLDARSVVSSLIALLSQPLEQPEPPMPTATAHLIPETLTERELDVVRLIAQGLSNHEIAGQLFLAPSTVKWYVSDILSKLDVANRTQASARAREFGLLD
jgi:predicted ATPase/DNA-binding CsgD family transcriptional regulator/DNA-binding XRE family transcriptional regulator